MFGAKAFALSARKKQHLHKNPGRCPGLLAAAPLGRRWVLVVVRADDLPSSSVANEGFAPLCGAAAISMAALKTPVASEGG